MKDTTSPLHSGIPRQSPWEFAKTLPTKQRLNYIYECLRYWKLEDMKNPFSGKSGMFRYDQSINGAKYWLKIISSADDW